MAIDEAVSGFIFDDIAKRLNNPDTIYTLHTRTKTFDAIPTGIKVIDDVLCGGFPEGRIIELFGPEASGKTTVALHLIAEAQRRGYVVYFIDAEHALDVDYAQRVGVNLKTLLFSQPEYGEEALDTVKAICDSTIAATDKFGKEIKSLIIVDSVPALVPKEAYDVYDDNKKEGLESSTGLALPARMLSKLLPPLLGRVSKSGATLVFINQERDNVGVMYGAKTTTPGGRALKFFASVRLKVQRIGYAESDGETIGIRSQITPVKSKLYPIFGRRAEFVVGNSGVDITFGLVEQLIETGTAKKSGAWYTIKEKRFQGRAQIVDELKKNSAFLKECEELLKPQQTKQVELKPIQIKPAPDKAIPMALPSSPVKVIGTPNIVMSPAPTTPEVKNGS